MQSDRYYRHSGRFSPLGVLAALVAGLAASVPMAFIYSYAIVYIPLVGIVSFVLSAGFAAVVGGTVGAVLHKGKVRNRAVAAATALLVGLFALWASWVTWVYALLHRADAQIGLLDLVSHPDGLWDLITFLNDKGVWTLKGLTPTGAFLWCLWALEAVIIVGVAVAVAHGSVSTPFCEDCDRWCEEEKGVARLGPTNADQLRPPLERRDYQILNQLPGASDQAFTRVDLHQCTQCRATATLSATSVTVSEKKGKREVSESPLLKLLVVPPADVSVVRALLAEAKSALA